MYLLVKEHREKVWGGENGGKSDTKPVTSED